MPLSILFGMVRQESQNSRLGWSRPGIGIGLNIRLAVSQNSEFSKTFGIDIENQNMGGQDQVLV